MSGSRPISPPNQAAVWFARRARNAGRRSALVASIAAVGFLVTLALLAIVPRQRQAEARLVASLLTQRVDTAPIMARRDQARDDLAAAEVRLANARARAVRPPTPPLVDTLAPELIARRDSLARAVAGLTEMLERVENAPLPATFRALGERPELAGDPRVALLLDSLASVERQREAFGAAGGVDPVFVALTAWASAIGRAIQEIADSRVTAARAEIERLRPPRPPPPVVVQVVDTLPISRRRDLAVATLDSANRLLVVARDSNAALEQRAARTRSATDLAMPPLAMLAAALVVGLGAAFGTALALEMRRARVADAGEAEMTTGLRVLATIRPRAPRPDRSRRRADRTLSALIDTESDSYRLVYLHIATASPKVSLVTITGDDPAVAATIATNVATAASYDARSVLLVDAELSADLVGSLLRVRGSRGLAEILSGSTDWTEAIASATIGRDRMLDVITSGRAGEPVGGYDPAPVRYHLARVARRYDLVVLVAPPAQVRRGADSILPAPDVIYCATLGRTPLHELGATVASLRGSGVRVHGVVLWDAGPPDIEGTSPMYDQADSGASLPISASHSADG